VTVNDTHLGLSDLPDIAIPTRRRKRRVAPPQEAAVQRAIIDALRWRGIYAAHVPNAGKRSRAAGKRLKGEGMKAGFPDLVVYGPRGKHMLLEVKRPGWSPSDVSDNQRDVHAILRDLGHVVEVVASIDDALAVLTREGWVR
jgi:hypothetical protein